MTSRILGAWSAAIIACCFISVSASKGEARTCELLFDSTEIFKKTTSPFEKIVRDLKLETSIDPKTNQTRAIGFVKIREDRELYVDFLLPEPGKEIATLVNGLTYRVGEWDGFVNELGGDGLGIFRFDPYGMGETMKKYGLPRDGIQLADQVQDMALLLDRFGIKKSHILGLSYGGGMSIMFGALYPNRVASLILEAPFTGPLPAVEKEIQEKIDWIRKWNPWNPATNAELYSYFLRQIVFTTYPLLEPIVLEHPFKLENVYRLTEGTKNFRASDFVDRLPKGKVHLIVAEKDEYIPAEILENFWNSIPKDVRASRMILLGSKHKIPETMPRYSAGWIKMIISGDQRIQNGDTWTSGKKGDGAGATEVEVKIK